MTTKLAMCSGAFLLLFGLRAEATTYTVSASGGGNFTTISACSSTANAGDTCDVMSGSYSGWTQGKSGSAGSVITFQAHTGSTVTITSNVNISNRSYIRLTGFTLTTSGDVITGNSGTTHNVIDHNVFQRTGTAFTIPDGQGSTGSDNIFSNNTMTAASNGNIMGLYLYGDRNLIDSNDIAGFDGDCMEIGGTNVVVRNNRCHDLDGSSSGQHIDFIQVIGGGTSPTLSYSLIEGNVEQNCLNDGNNCHFVIVRTGSGPVADTIIMRYNYAQNMDGSGVSMGGVGDNAPNAHFYFNTMATGAMSAENGDGISFQNAANGVVLNNIFYQCEANQWSPTVGLAVGNGNIMYNPGYTGGWNSPVLV